MSLRFVSAGAAHGLVDAVAREYDVAVSGNFGAVGAMLEKLDGGEPADIVILTRAQVELLAAQSRVLPQSVADLGIVPTAIAVRNSDSAPDVASATGLRAALIAADAIHFPDPGKATAGIHFDKVVDRLGIRSEVQARLRTFPNGASAMRALADAGGRPIGCTQATEILATPGVRLVGPLPPGFELDTLYTAAVYVHAADRNAATAFVQKLTGSATRRRRTAAGFR